MWPRRNCCTTRASATTSILFGLWSGASYHRRLDHLIYPRRVLPLTDLPLVICVRGRGGTTGIPFLSTALSVSATGTILFPPFTRSIPTILIFQIFVGNRSNTRRIVYSIKFIDFSSVPIKILCLSVLLWRRVSGRWCFQCPFRNAFLLSALQPGLSWKGLGKYYSGNIKSYVLFLLYILHRIFGVFAE